MSIAAIGTLPDTRITAANTVPTVAQQAVRGSATSLDTSLPITSQVPELDQLQTAVDTFNGYIPMAANNLMFSIDDDNGQVIVKIVDSSTQDVIRQIPSEEALEISRSLDKLKGLLLTSRA